MPPMLCAQTDFSNPHNLSIYECIFVRSILLLLGIINRQSGYKLLKENLTILKTGNIAKKDGMPDILKKNKKMNARKLFTTNFSKIA